MSRLWRVVGWAMGLILLGWAVLAAETKKTEAPRLVGQTGHLGAVTSVALPRKAKRLHCPKCATCLLSASAATGRGSVVAGRIASD